MTGEMVRPSVAVARARACVGEALRWIERAGIETGPVRNADGTGVSKPRWLLDLVPGDAGLADLPLVLDRFSDDQLRAVWVQVVVSVAAEDGFTIGALAVALNYVRERLDGKCERPPPSAARIPPPSATGEGARSAASSRRVTETLTPALSQREREPDPRGVNGSAVRRRGGRGDGSVTAARMAEARRLAPNIGDSFALNEIGCPPGSHGHLRGKMESSGEFTVSSGRFGVQDSVVVTRIAVGAMGTKETS